MTTSTRASRIIGALILAQMVGGFLVNFVLQKPLFGTAGFLVNAAPHSRQIALSVLLGLAMGAISVAIAITIYPIFRPHGQALALWFFALAVVSLSVAVVEQMHVLSMVSLSEAYARASVAEHDQFQVLRGVVAWARNWAHFVGLIIAGATLFVFYLALYRYALVPRALSAFGLVAVLLQMTTVARPLFGQDVVFPMLAPLGLSQLVLALWLIVGGFRSKATPVTRTNDV